MPQQLQLLLHLSIFVQQQQLNLIPPAFSEPLLQLPLILFAELQLRLSRFLFSGLLAALKFHLALSFRSQFFLPPIIEPNLSQ